MLSNKRFFIKYIVTFLDFSVSCWLNIATEVGLSINLCHSRNCKRQKWYVISNYSYHNRYQELFSVIVIYIKSVY